MEFTRVLFRSVERIELSVIAPEINRPVQGEGRGGAHGAPGEELPLQGPVWIQGIEIAVVRAEVDRAIGIDGRGGIDPRAGQELPPLGSIRIDGVEFVRGGRAEIDRAIAAEDRRRRDRTVYLGAT